MKVNLLQLILDYEGKPVKDENGKEIELRAILSTALNSQLRDEILTAEDKNKIFQLSVKLWKDDEADFTVDDLAFMKERVGKIHTPLAFGRVAEIFEGKKEEDLTKV